MIAAYQRVLAAFDLESPSDTPLLAGLRLADEQSATLRLVAAVRPALLSAKGFFNPQLIDRVALLQEARSALNARIAAATVEPVAADVIIGDPGEVIANAAEHRNSDLVVVGARQREGAEHLLGTTATKVLREADGVDVYACHRSDPENPTDVVVIAIDGSAVTADVVTTSARFLNAGASPAKTHDVHVVCVVPPAARQRTERLLARCETFLADSSWPAMEVRVADDVTDALEACVRDYDADLLIIGSGENMGLGWSIASTTNDVLHDVVCDVLVVRPDKP